MTLTQYAAPLRQTPVDEVTTEAVLDVLQQLWTVKPETASRVRGILAKFLGISEVMLILPAAIFAGIAGPLTIVAIAERFRLRSALGLG